MYCAPGLHCPCTNLKIINYTVLLSIHVNNPRVLKVEFLDNWWTECSINWLFFIGYNHILFGYIVLYVNIIRRRPFYQIYILKRWVFIYDVSIPNLFGFFLKCVFNFENDSLKPLLINKITKLSIIKTLYKMYKVFKVKNNLYDTHTFLKLC